MRTDRLLFSALSLVQLGEQTFCALSALSLSAFVTVSHAVDAGVVFHLEVFSIGAFLEFNAGLISVEECRVTFAVKTLLSSGHVGFSALVASSSEVVTRVTLITAVSAAVVPLVLTLSAFVESNAFCLVIECAFWANALSWRCWFICYKCYLWFFFFFFRNVGSVALGALSGVILADGAALAASLALALG